MAVTYLKDEKTKAKTTSKSKLATEKDAQINTLAGELLDIDTTLGPHKAEVDIISKAYNDKRKELDALLDIAPTDGLEILVKGKGLVKIGPMATKTVLTKPELAAKALNDAKPGLFMELATVTLGNLKKYLSGVEFDKITDTSQDGARRFTLKHNE